MPDQQAVAQRSGREGGRWINARPTSEEFAEWFKSSMRIDEELRAEDYIGGVVIIPAVDSKAKQVTGFNTKGAPVIEEVPELSYNPYAKVETRIAYFWDLLDVHADWVGVIENVKTSRVPLDMITIEEVVHEEGEKRTHRQMRQPGALTVLVHQLPEGFSIMSVPVNQGYSHFLLATIRVSIFRADENGEPKGRPLRTGRGTKQVPLLLGRDHPYADSNSLMKAETGALGRALGFAGIFVIPGGGVATAEDMLESMAQGTTAVQEAVDATNQGPAAPAAAPVRTGAEQQVDDEAQLRANAIALYKALADEAPGKAEEFGEWMQSRRLRSFGDASGAALRGAVKKLEKLKDEHEHSAQQQPTQETLDVPAETPAPAEGSGGSPSPQERADGQPSGSDS